MQKTTIILHYTREALIILGSLFAVYLGYKLFILGVTGEASIVVESKELGAQLINASPGLIFAIGGLICLGIAAYKRQVIKIR